MRFGFSVPASAQESVGKLAAACKKEGNKTKTQCCACVSHYKTLTRRWAKNAKLKAWWASKTTEQQQQWYQEQKALNQSRSSDDKVVLTVESFTVKKEEVRGRYHWHRCKH